MISVARVLLGRLPFPTTTLMQTNISLRRWTLGICLYRVLRARRWGERWAEGGEGDGDEVEEMMEDEILGAEIGVGEVGETDVVEMIAHTFVIDEDRSTNSRLRGQCRLRLWLSHVQLDKSMEKDHISGWVDGRTNSNTLLKISSSLGQTSKDMYNHISILGLPLSSVCRWGSIWGINHRDHSTTIHNNPTLASHILLSGPTTGRTSGQYMVMGMVT